MEHTDNEIPCIEIGIKYSVVFLFGFILLLAFRIFILALPQSKGCHEEKTDF